MFETLVGDLVEADVVGVQQLVEGVAPGQLGQGGPERRDLWLLLTVAVEG